MTDPQKIAEIEQQMVENDVRYVTIALPDTNGALRGKLVSRARFLSALKSGTGAAPAFLALDATDAMLAMPGVTDDDADFHDAVLEVDPDSGRAVPWEAPHRNLLYLANFTGATSALCPRSTLKRVLAKGESMGFVPRYGFEFEYTLFDETPASLREKGFRNLTPATPFASNCLVAYQTLQSDWYESVIEMCESLNIDMVTAHEEIGAGFMEVCLGPQDGLEGADQGAVFKNMLRALAMRNNKLLTYMPRWSAEADSQSTHVHISLLDNEGNPTFYDADGTHNMSQTMRHFLGGLQRYTREIFLLFAPTVNSYRRFTPDSFAPMHGAWGFENRTCCFRIVGSSPNSIRIENRQPGSDTNPYLTIAGIFAAGLAGIEEQIEPLDEVIGNGFAQEVDESIQFPTTILESITNLRESQFARKSLGDAFVDAFALSRESQEAEFRSKVPDVELERFFELI
ncbi:MAG: glutamine synthetase family protein [Candidatus Promineifilaceae bacterium]